MRAVTIAMLFGLLAFAGGLAAQEEDAPEQPEGPKHLEDQFEQDAVKADNPRQYGYKRNTVFPQSLFSGEHLRPYERRGDVKRYALMGTWSIDARASCLMRFSDRSRNGYDLFGRLRFGPAGIDFRHTSFDDEDKNGTTIQSLESIFSVRLTADLDISHMLVVRPVFGWSKLDHNPSNRDDDAFCYGAELELFPLKPLTFNFGYLAYQSNKIGSTTHDLSASIGILPLLLTNSDEYPSVHPELRIGIRRLIGKRDSIATTGITIELGFGF